MKRYFILVDFVIRNTTNGQVVVFDYGVSDSVSIGLRTFRYYDLETADLLTNEDFHPITLQPLGTIGRTVLIERIFNYQQRVDRPPATLRVFAETSEAIRVQKEVELKQRQFVVHADITYTEDDGVHLSRYVDKIESKEPEEPPPDFIEESEIPF